MDNGKMTGTTGKNADKHLGMLWYPVAQPQPLRHDADGNLAAPCYTGPAVDFHAKGVSDDFPKPEAGTDDVVERATRGP